MLYRLTAIWRNITRRAEAEAELNAEVDSVVDMLTDEYERSGMPRAVARRQALRSVGGSDQLKEQVRDAKRGYRIEGLRADSKYAFRALRHAPASSIIIIATLAITMGANTAIYSVVNALLLQRLPYHEPDRVVSIDHPPVGLSLASGQPEFRLSKSVRESSVLESSAIYYTGGGANLEGANAARINIAQVEPAFMRTLGAEPITGRDFSAADAGVSSGDPAAASRAVLISENLWRRMGASASPVGRQLRLSGQSYTVIGVMPSHVDFPVGTDAWIPTPLRMDLAGAAAAPEAIARIRKGVSISDAQHALATAYVEAHKSNPDARPDFMLIGLQDNLTASIRTPLALLLATVIAVLLIGCANVAGLLLARISSRENEFITRGALGAEPGRITRQVLSEALLLALAAAVCGIAVATTTLRIIVSLFPPETLPRDSVHLSTASLAYSAAVSGMVALAFGSFPAMRASKAARRVPRSVSATMGRGQMRFASALVTGEIAVGVVLVLSAGLLTRSLARLTSTPLGLQPAHVTTTQVHLPANRYGDAGAKLRYADATLRRVRAIPGVTNAGLATALPFDHHMGVGLEVRQPGDTAPVTDVRKSSTYVIATPGYLEALGVHMVAGRAFNEDDGRDSPVFIISETVARRVFGTANAVGRTIAIPSRRKTGIVVGVVEDVHFHNVDDTGAGVVLEPMRQSSPTSMLTFVVQSRSAIAGELRSALVTVDANVPPYDIRSMRSVIDAAMGARSTLPKAVAMFAILALFLCALGVYGLQAEIVARQSRALSIRAALGASATTLVGMILARTIRLSAAGIAIGLVVSLAFTRVLATVLYQTSPLDATTFAIAPIVILSAGLLASVIPATRAARIQAASMLKE